MIWNGKRYAGIEVHVGRKDGECSGEYIVVYKCSGVFHKYGEAHYEAATALMLGERFPAIISSVHAAYLHENYRPLSQRKIPQEDQAELDCWIEDVQVTQ